MKYTSEQNKAAFQSLVLRYFNTLAHRMGKNAYSSVNQNEQTTVDSEIFART